MIIFFSVDAVGNNKHMNDIVRKNVNFLKQIFHCNLYIIWPLAALAFCSGV